jgi:hypothetical protein
MILGPSKLHFEAEETVKIFNFDASKNEVFRILCFLRPQKSLNFVGYEFFITVEN